ncbi:uncharacterized protein BDV14DRAFT_163854 [Aspergillus stella-maris]|uniref:uncharacterized protein n=1 Tax=Aspergillus stella-maris TaxID=1810926 RepID=UPI003CCE1B7B
MKSALIMIATCMGVTAVAAAPVAAPQGHDLKMDIQQMGSKNEDTDHKSLQGETGVIPLVGIAAPINVALQDSDVGI